jgi:hypothetical protein
MAIKNIAYYVVERFSEFEPLDSVRAASSEMEQVASVRLSDSRRVRRWWWFQIREIFRSPSRSSTTERSSKPRYP